MWSEFDSLTNLISKKKKSINAQCVSGEDIWYTGMKGVGWKNMVGENMNKRKLLSSPQL
jgi:hypothetical protein